MVPRNLLASLALVFSFLPLVSAHQEEVVLDAWKTLGIPDPLNVLIYASVIASIAIVFSLLFQKSLGPRKKKFAFLAIVIPIAFATLYLSATTVYLNVVSESGGPVHWHADYEVWACGEKYELIDPTGLENRVGSPTIHEHNDNRIHIEGVLFKLKEAELGEYFEKIGGEYTKEQLGLLTHDGYKVWRNGDLCNGLPGRWHLFVNSALNEQGPEHVIAPYTLVPPGDRLKLVFTEKSEQEVNGVLGVEP